MSRIWAETDCGKTHHHTLVLDSEGSTLLSRRVANDEPELLKLIGDVLDLADDREVTWAMDMTGGEPALLIALLINHGQELVYLPGIAVNRASAGYRGAGDARDTRVIADQARMRRDLQPIRPGDDASIELRLLTERRTDLVAAPVPAEQHVPGPGAGPGHRHGRVAAALDGLPEPGGDPPHRLTTWLRNRKVRNPEALAAKAVEAAERQHTAVAGESAIAKMVHTLAKEVMTLNEKITETDKLIEGRFREHELAEVIPSLPGIGTTLGAEFLVAVGGSLDGFPGPDRLAAFAGVAPTPRDSGKVTGNHHRPRRYHRRLQRVFYTSAPSASSATPTRGSSTTENAPRANATFRPCSPSPADASTSCGP